MHSLRSNKKFLNIPDAAFNNMTSFPVYGVAKLVAVYKLIAMKEQTDQAMSAFRNDMSRFITDLILEVHKKSE